MMNSLQIILCAFIWKSPVGEAFSLLCYLVFFCSKWQKTILINKQKGESLLEGCDMTQIKKSSIARQCKKQGSWNLRGPRWQIHDDFSGHCHWDKPDPIILLPLSLCSKFKFPKRRVWLARQELYSLTMALFHDFLVKKTSSSIKIFY